MKDRMYAVDVGQRLRASAWELGYRSQQELADWLGATRAQVYTWYRGLALPPVKYTQKLAERGITMDWIYRGDGAGLSNAIYIRLMAAMEQDSPPPDVPPEPEAKTESGTAPANPLNKGRGRPSLSVRQRRANVA
jgi:Bacteriophage CI repressor helix-turn-helix domain